ncbi:DUF7282 domain-containing protein [Methanolobus halotolerans]|uniref:DUF7282 domain-containing protein n=1 Tax=Methanolobus halotolerans TaxID=2052935 RepID=A0A4E0PWZ5_9EURY|nr:hypothetical protein [Methanolobus halotolerans]TGC10635.1 hypothetical protein CUN85_03855 [Methanolobus halotolerans]
MSILLIIVLFSGSATAQYDKGNEVTISNTSDGQNTLVNNESAVIFEDQVSDGNSVVVTMALLPEGGYVVIRELMDGASGPLAGNSGYLEPGEYSLVEVELREPIDSGQELIAMTHIDDGDEMYEFPGPDVAYSVDGDIVSDSAMVTIETEANSENNESAVSFEDQDTEGNMVVVDSVSLPDGGYVVIHASENGSAGDVIGHSQYMETGNHSDVEIRLDAPIETDQEVIAMTHMDDGDGVYQFPGPDVPYTSDNVPVTDSAMITVENGSSSQTPGFGIVLTMGLLFVAGYCSKNRRM